MARTPSLNILLTGASGQLGSELYPLLSRIGRVTAADHNPALGSMPGCLQVDLGDAGQLENLLNRCDPGLIVNAAAYTAVDRAEEEVETAFLVNGEAPGRLARWAERNDRALLHYSTDYVFDGSAERPYVESDPTAPLNIYGESKLAGELAVRACNSRSLILRTSWVYSAHGSNFVLSMLRLARRRPHLRIVNDQVGCPTWARNLARASLRCIEQGLLGPGEGCSVYHYCDRDAVSWYEFASLVFAHGVRIGLLDRVPEHEGIGSEDYPQAAQRPRYSVLDARALRAAAGVEQPGLRESLLECMKEVAIDD